MEQNRDHRNSPSKYTQTFFGKTAKTIQRENYL